MSDIDVHLFRSIHDALGGWTGLMAALTMVGGGWGALSIAPFFASARTRRFGAWFAGTIAVNALLVFVLKVHVARPRPCNVMADIHPLVFPVPSDFSFPSGHSAGSFCFAAFVSVVLVRTRTGSARFVVSAALLALATGVALSRIALGVHFPGDVAAGAIIGATIGVLGSSLYVGRPRTIPSGTASRPSAVHAARIEASTESSPPEDSQ